MAEVDPTMGDAINININIININLCPAMAEVDPTMGDAKESTSRLEDIKYYTRCYLSNTIDNNQILHKVLVDNDQILYWSIININIIAIWNNPILVDFFGLVKFNYSAFFLERCASFVSLAFSSSFPLSSTLPLGEGS